jgi:hypothetical protein
MLSRRGIPLKAPILSASFTLTPNNNNYITTLRMETPSVNRAKAIQAMLFLARPFSGIASGGTASLVSALLFNADAKTHGTAVVVAGGTVTDDDLRAALETRQ